MYNLYDEEDEDERRVSKVGINFFVGEKLSYSYVLLLGISSFLCGKMFSMQYPR